MKNRRELFGQGAHACAGAIAAAALGAPEQPGHDVQAARASRVFRSLPATGLTRSG